MTQHLKVWTKQKPQVVPAHAEKLEPVIEIDHNEEFKDRRRGANKELFQENKAFNTRLNFAIGKLAKQLTKGVDLREIFLRRNKA